MRTAVASISSVCLVQMASAVLALSVCLLPVFCRAVSAVDDDYSDYERYADVDDDALTSNDAIWADYLALRQLLGETYVNGA